MRHVCAALLLATLAACGGGQGTGSLATPISTPPPPPPVTAPVTSTSGCGSPAKLATGLQTLTSDNTQRSYWVEMPPNIHGAGVTLGNERDLRVEDDG